MTFNLSKILPNQKPKGNLVVLLATCQPDQRLLDTLSGFPSLALREAFTTQGTLQSLVGANLVILGEVMSIPGLSNEVLTRTLETSGIPVVSIESFLEQPEEWLARAKLASARQVTILPSRQVKSGELVRWRWENDPGYGRLQAVCRADEFACCFAGTEHGGLRITCARFRRRARILHPCYPSYAAIPLGWSETIPDGRANGRSDVERGARAHFERTG